MTAIILYICNLYILFTTGFSILSRILGRLEVFSEPFKKKATRWLFYKRAHVRIVDYRE